uniref:Lipocalin n=1 Tax=Rhipicephalus zambeziensis TaxID=60191 RepID=A0A224YNB9_9ACAR
MVRTLKLTVLIGLITSAASVTIDDLRNVLQTHMQKLWTLYRSFDVETRGHKHKCIYAEVRRVGTDQYRYLQHYEVANTWRSNMYVAKLLPPERRGQGPIMRISSYQKGGLFVDYTLLFWDQESHCALFTRNYNSKKQCEMHVWSDHVGRHVSRCQMAYIAYCRGLPELPIYTKQCRP